MIARSAINGTKPVSVQTGVYKNMQEVSLDQQLPVSPTFPKLYTDGLKVHVEGELNGGHVKGDLLITQELKKGDLLKVLKEDGTNRYVVLNDL